MNGMYIGNNKVLIQPKWGGHLYAPANDLSISPILITNGIYESALTTYFINNIKAGDVVFDIGAHIGYYTVLLGFLVRDKGHVFAYEPNPNMYSYLEDNVSSNYLYKQVSIYNKAVYSSQEKLKLHISERFTGHSSIKGRNDADLQDFDDRFDSNKEEIEVIAEPLDIYCEKLSKIDLIKIDVEGCEYDVFLGMEKLLKNNIVNTIVFELSKQALEKDFDAFKEFLRRTAYDYDMSFFSINSSGELIHQALEQLFKYEYISAVVMKKRG